MHYWNPLWGATYNPLALWVGVFTGDWRHHQANPIYLATPQHKKLILRNRFATVIRVAGITFKRVASQNIPQLAQRPQTFSSRTEQAEKSTDIKAFVFWGYPRLKLTVDLPFNEMRAFFATLLKVIPATLYRPRNASDSARHIFRFYVPSI
jgi:hypothetical protein